VDEGKVEASREGSNLPNTVTFSVYTYLECFFYHDNVIGVGDKEKSKFVET
jgi:hypothetical protein